MTAALADALVKHGSASTTQEAAEARVIAPTGDRVLCRAMPHLRQTGSIILVGGKRLDVTVSQVIARGPDVKARPWHLAPGDYVMHARVVGVRYDGVLGALGRNAIDREGNLIFLREEELLGVVDPELVESMTGEVVAPRVGTVELKTK
jgi:hypothetical protein